MQPTLSGDINSEPWRSAWWMWLVMPVASYFGGYVASFLVGFPQTLILALLTGMNRESWWLLNVVPLTTYAAFSLIAVMVSYEMAPRAKVASAISTAALITIVLSLAAIGTADLPEVSASDHAFRIGLAGSTLACIFAVVKARAMSIRVQASET